MGFVEEVLSNKEELLIKFLSLIEGKETKANICLDGIQFDVGGTKIKVHGNVEFTIVPGKVKKKK
jgi:ABC-type multidrug transport system fused ATPase/permease subunit